eukprot:Awhi_evm1s3068
MITFDSKYTYVMEFEKQPQNKNHNCRVPRAAIKMKAAAKRAKEVLSANTQTKVQIEGILVDVDFRTAITREQFEKLAEDLYPRAFKPIQMALDAADMQLVSLVFFDLSLLF